MSRALEYIIMLKLLRPPISTLFPYTTLFRSRRRADREQGRGGHPDQGDRAEVADLVRGHREAERGAERQVGGRRSEEHTSELQSHVNLVCRLLLEKKKDLKVIIKHTV